MKALINFIERIFPVKAIFRYAVVVMALSLAFSGILKLVGDNTVMAQIIGMFVVVLLSMFITVQPFKQNLEKYNFAKALKLGVLGGFVGAAFMLLSEIVIRHIFHANIEPDVFHEFWLRYHALQIMLVYEMLGFSIISSLILYFHYKKPLHDSKYDHYHVRHSH